MPTGETQSGKYCPFGFPGAQLEVRGSLTLNQCLLYYSPLAKLTLHPVFIQGLTEITPDPVRESLT